MLGDIHGPGPGCSYRLVVIEDVLSEVAIEARNWCTAGRTQLAWDWGRRSWKCHLLGHHWLLLQSSGWNGRNCCLLGRHRLLLLQCSEWHRDGNRRPNGHVPRLRHSAHHRGQFVLVDRQRLPIEQPLHNVQLLLFLFGRADELYLEAG